MLTNQEFEFLDSSKKPLLRIIEKYQISQLVS